MKIYNHNIEPLELLFTKYDFNINDISDIISGQRYTAVLLSNGNIGVCANLKHIVKTEIKNYSELNLEIYSHRIVANAYFNALLNYSNHYTSNVDIFEFIDFSNYNKVVMLGSFEPVIKKFRDNGISISVFDTGKNDNTLVPMSEQEKYTCEADSLILTSTSISNSTFLNVINNTKKNCDVYMLGPSSIMSQEMFEYRNIKMIFGSTFEKFDYRVLEIIKNNGGTKEFLKYGKKRCLSNYKSN